MMIGVALDSTDVTGGTYTKATAWMFYCYDGNLYNSVSGKQQLYDVKVKGGNRVGDVIGVEVNVEGKTLQFFVNEAAAGPMFHLPLRQQQLTHLAAAVDLGPRDDSVEVLESS